MIGAARGVARDVARDAEGRSLLERPAAEVVLRASRHELARRIANGLESAGIGPTDELLLLVSGGSDSMALLLSIVALRARRAASVAGISVLSVDHGIRPEAGAEVRSVVATAADLGLRRVFGRRVDVATGGNLLEAAREARYATATSLARELGGATLVVAHQAEDRAESFLMALARREGLAACTKLMPRREFPDWLGAQVARPLLDCSRAELRALLQECGVSWIEDPSNADHRRGALRSDPAARQLIECISGGLARASDEASELLALRDELVERALDADGHSCSRMAFDALPPSARAAMLARMARVAGVDVAQAVLVEAARSTARGVRRWTCADGAELVTGRDRVRYERLRAESPTRAASRDSTAGNASDESPSSEPVTSPAGTRP